MMNLNGKLSIVEKNILKFRRDDMEDSIRNIIESLEWCFKDAYVHNFDLESEVCLNMTFKELQILLYELHKENGVVIDEGCDIEDWIYKEVYDEI